MKQLNANGLLNSYYPYTHWLLSFGMCDSKFPFPERFSKELLKAVKLLKVLAKFEVWLKWIYQRYGLVVEIAIFCGYVYVLSGWV